MKNILYEKQFDEKSHADNLGGLLHMYFNPPEDLHFKTDRDDEIMALESHCKDLAFSKTIDAKIRKNNAEINAARGTGKYNYGNF